MKLPQVDLPKTGKPAGVDQRKACPLLTGLPDFYKIKFLSPTPLCWISHRLQRIMNVI